VAAETGTEQLYASALGELWGDLQRTLARLDHAAAEPSRLDESHAELSLRRLQYGLHVSLERVFGLEPPAGGETAHAELVAALESARDATAEVVDAVSRDGAAAAEPLLHAWRGTLLRVRLARLRLGAPARETVTEPAADHESLRAPLVSFLLALLGAVAFVAGVTTGIWLVWAAGILAVAASIAVYRP
jgi:hypothetical protein